MIGKMVIIMGIVKAIVRWMEMIQNQPIIIPKTAITVVRSKIMKTTEMMIALSTQTRYLRQLIQAAVILQEKVRYTRRVKISEGDAIIQRRITSRPTIDQRAKSGLISFEKMRMRINSLEKGLSRLTLLPRMRQNKYILLDLISTITTGKYSFD